LVLRETRSTFGTTQLGYLWAIITPAAGITVLVVLFSIWGRQAPFGSSLALFFATGILTLEFFRKLSSSLMNALNANKALLTYPLIKETDTLYARFLLILTTYLVVMAVFYSGLIASKLAQFPAYPQELIQAFGATALLGFGFGVLNAVIVSSWESWRQVEKILTRPLFFISGIFYIPSSLPAEAINILKWNPVLHLVEWMREGFYPNYGSTVLDKDYPLGVAVLLILLGLAGERLYRKRRV
jgi:capsular polysaccharide transport system permease protein